MITRRPNDKKKSYQSSESSILLNGKVLKKVLQKILQKILQKVQQKV